MPDPVLRFDFALAAPRGVAADACARWTQRAFALLAERDAGPSVWTRDGAPFAPEGLAVGAYVELVGAWRDREVQAQATLVATGARVALRWAWPSPAPLVEALAAITLALHRERPPGTRFDTLASLAVGFRHEPSDDARLRAHWTGVWSAPSVLDAIDLAAPFWRYPAPPDAFAALPPGVHESDGTLLMLRWAGDPLDAAELARAAAAQLDWLATAFEGPPAAAAAAPRPEDDRRIIAALAPHPSVTLYDPATAAVHQALYVDDAGGLSADDRALLAAFVHALDAGRLRDGTPVASVTIDCPSRAAALALAPQLRGSGLRVAYARGAGELWDPFPEGAP